MKYFSFPGIVKRERRLGAYDDFVKFLKKRSKRIVRHKERKEINAALVELEEAA